MFSLYIGTLFTFSVLISLTALYGKLTSTDESFYNSVEEGKKILQFVPMQEDETNYRTIFSIFSIITYIALVSIFYFYFPSDIIIIWSIIFFAVTIERNESVAKMVDYVTGVTDEINYEECRATWLQVINCFIISGGLGYVFVKVCGG